MSYLDSLLTTGFDEDNELIMSENEDKEILDNEEAQISEYSHEIIETYLFKKYG
tara:strand:- start:138 stop:299 length:162 start_codon:yes stop_codon:yes gene_type:complete